MLNYRKSQSTFSRFLRPFLALLFPVILFGIFIYHYNLDSNRNYIDQTRLYSFQQASTQLGYIFEQLEGMAADMASAGLPTSGENLPAAEQQLIFDFLTNCEQQAAVACQAFYYIRGEAYLYSSSAWLPYSQFEQEHVESSFTFSSFFSRMNSATSPVICPISPNPASPTSGGNGLIAVLCPLAVQSGLPDADVFFLIEEQVLSEKFQNYFGNSQGQLCVYTDSLDLLLSKQDPPPPIETLVQYQGLGLLHQPDGEEVVLRQITTDGGLIIISIMPTNEFYRDLQVTQGILVLLLVMMVLCCIVIVAVGVQYAYRPFRRLAQEILGPDHGSRRKNEIDLIRDAFDTSQERSQSLMQQLDNQNRMLSRQFVNRLISGKFQSFEELLGYARCFGLAANRKYWVVMQLVSTPASFSQQLMDRLLEDSGNFRMPGVDCLSSEFLQHPGICYLFHFDCGETPEEFCKGIADRLCEWIRSEGLTSFRIGVGSPYSDPMQVKRSSYEADAALENATDFDSGRLYFYHPEQEPPSEGLCLPPTEKSLLIAGVSRGDAEVSLQALESLIQYIEASAHSFLLARLLCSELSNALFRLAQENRISYRQSNWTELVAYHDLREFRCSAQELTTYLCEQIQKRLEQDIVRQKNEVLSFISQNFTREDFSMDLVADSLNMTKTKIGAIVKEAIGMGFPQYISLLRLNEIKRQLVETDLPIQEVIRGTGYLDVSNFIRHFKTLEGLTPGQYRAAHREK